MKEGTRTSYPLLLRTLLVDLRLSAAEPHTTRFIILGNARTGSNLLATSIARHPSTLVCGELFVDRRRAFADPYPLFPWSVPIRNRFPVRFLKRKVFRRMPAGTRAAGFKIFYHQCDWKPADGVWTFLAAENVKVIHLKRRNFLRAHLSLRKALLTDRWFQVGTANEDTVSVRLEPEDCEKAFSEMRACELRFDALFERHSRMEMFYEELDRDYGAQMARVWDFLNLERVSIDPVLNKQARMPLARAIENYPELKAHFSNTPWAAFFDD